MPFSRSSSVSPTQRTGIILFSRAAATFLFMVALSSSRMCLLSECPARQNFASNSASISADISPVNAPYGWKTMIFFSRLFFIGRSPAPDPSFSFIILLKSLKNTYVSLAVLFIFQFAAIIMSVICQFLVKEYKFSLFMFFPFAFFGSRKEAAQFFPEQEHADPVNYGQQENHHSGPEKKLFRQ